MLFTLSFASVRLRWCRLKAKSYNKNNFPFAVFLFQKKLLLAGNLIFLSFSSSRTCSSSLSAATSGSSDFHSNFLPDDRRQFKDIGRRDNSFSSAIDFRLKFVTVFTGLQV